MSINPAKPSDGIAWVTGASSGIGRALALKLASQGWHVVASARGVDALDKLAAEAANNGLSITPYPLDVTDRGSCELAVHYLEDKIGPIALSIFNAGIYQPVYGETLETDDFVKTFNVNLYGVVYAMVPLIAAMKKRGAGQIALVSSVTGYGGLPSSAAYGATKAALINMAESLKFDLDKLGILIQIVNPGFVDTPATKENAFEMPALVSVETAANRIAAGLAKGGFEITFPKRFTYVLKFLRFMPYGLYFWLMNRLTGWKDRASEQPKPND